MSLDSAARVLSTARTLASESTSAYEKPGVIGAIAPPPRSRRPRPVKSLIALILEEQLETVAELSRQGHFDDRGRNQHLERRAVEVTDNSLDQLVVRGRREDDERIVFLVCDDTHVADIRKSYAF